MNQSKEKRILFWLTALGILAIIIASVIQLSVSKQAPKPILGYLEINDEDQIKGPLSAQLTIVEYSDFECPFCAQSAAYLDRFLKDYPNDARLVYRYFPLTSIHRNAYNAALAAEAASEQDKFWEMHNLLFAKQDEWSRLSNPSIKFQEYADGLDMDVEQFRSDLLNKTGQHKIDYDLEAAKNMDLRGTPTIFANGEQIKNFSNYEDLKKELEKYVK